MRYPAYQQSHLDHSINAAIRQGSKKMVMPIAATFIGLVIGHLLELVLDRSYSDAPAGGPLVRCSACRSPIRPLHLLPLLGYLWHRGRCPDCGQRLPPRALLLPPASALVFALAALVSDQWTTTILGGIFGTIFLALLATDLERRLIPNRIVYPAMLLAMALSWAWPDRNAAQAFAGGGLAFAIMLIIFIISLGRFGFGDVKMATLMGFAAGFPAMTVGLFFTAISAGLIAALLLLTGVVRRGQYIPYGPFIALGAIIALLWGDPIIDWYTG
ncbi:MAG: prepilin peptidase [Dehalococcoidia bacterium]